jgi:membrane protein implicated in regulation of membrane protease activity
MLMIGAVEAVGLGASAVHLDIDADAPGPDLLAWLGVGRIPILMLLVVLLALFGIVGLAVQQLAVGLMGSPLSPWIAGATALAAALPLAGLGSRGLARILPQDETTAVSRDSLLGKRGIVTVGTARRGSPAQARVRDLHGQPHYVMVEPQEEAHPFGEGDTVLLVGRDGDTFIGIGEADGLTPHVTLPAALEFKQERMS